MRALLKLITRHPAVASGLIGLSFPFLFVLVDAMPGRHGLLFQPSWIRGDPDPFVTCLQVQGRDRLVRADEFEELGIAAAGHGYQMPDGIGPPKNVLTLARSSEVGQPGGTWVEFDSELGPEEWVLVDGSYSAKADAGTLTLHFYDIGGVGWTTVSKFKGDTVRLKSVWIRPDTPTYVLLPLTLLFLACLGLPSAIVCAILGGWTVRSLVDNGVMPRSWGPAPF